MKTLTWRDNLEQGHKWATLHPADKRSVELVALGRNPDREAVRAVNEWWAKDPICDACVERVPVVVQIIKDWSEPFDPPHYCLACLEKAIALASGVRP